MAPFPPPQVVTDAMEEGSPVAPAKSLDPETLPVVLTDDVKLPGETHRIEARWDEEVAVLAALPGADGFG